MHCIQSYSTGKTQTINIMDELWKDPRYIGTRFAQIARARGFTTKQIREFVSQQEAHQLTKTKGTKKINYFPILRPPGSFQADLMFADNPRNKSKQLPILCIIDTNTRYAYTYLLKNKTDKEVLGAFQSFIHDSYGKCVELQTDNGSEFINKTVESFLEANGIHHYTAEPNDHNAQGSVERFNQTLRRLMTLTTDQTGLPWTDFLPQITENYNHRVNRAIGVAPVDATEDEGRFVRYLQYLEAKKRLDEFKPGEQVRKQLYRHKLEKGPVRWSKEIFTVRAIIDNHVVLNDDTNWQYYHLQKISDETTAGSRGPTDKDRQDVVKAKKADRDFRAEGIEKVQEFDGDQYVGRKIRKKYGNKFINGVVVSYEKPKRGDPSLGFNWLVKHEDGDQETMSLAELEKYKA